MRTRGLTGFVAASLATPLLASCGIPQNSTPQIIQEAPTDFEESFAVDAEEFGPSADAEETVESFLRASSGDPDGRDDRLNAFSEDQHEYSDPSDPINLLGGVDYAVENDGSDTVTVTVTGSVIGSYRPDGQVWMSSAPGAYQEEFVLERERPGELWTIVDPPQQVVMLDDQFQRAYERAPLYFEAAGQSGLLVPDLRWIYGRLDAETDRRTRLGWLFQGPSAWAQSTRSVIPLGTTESIDETDGVVQIDLTLGEPAELESGTIDTIAAQIAWSLDLPGEFELSINGEAEISGSLLNDWRDWNAIPSDTEEIGYFIADDTVWRFENDNVTDRSADHPWVGFTAPGLSEVAVSDDGQLAAVITDQDGTRLEIGTGEGRMEVVEGLSGDLHDPQWLRDETVILVDDGDLTAVGAADGDAQVLSGGEASALALAPDGHRLAYVEDGGAQAASLIHDADGNLQIGDSRPIGPSISGVTDVAWSSEDFLWIAGEHGDDGLFRVSIDNSRLEIQSGTSNFPTIRQIAASPADPLERNQNRGEPTVVVIDGGLYRVYTANLQPINPAGDGQPVQGSAPFTVL